MYTLIGTVLVIGIAVLVHELGHFIIARRNGVRVEEFCIGFPPRICSFQGPETKYSIGWIPVGGFVKMAGEDPEAVSGAPDEFFSKSIPTRIRIALAGPFGNFVCAYFCVLLYLWTGGVRDARPAPVFGSIPATEIYQECGIQVGDRIIDVRGRPAETFYGSVEHLTDSADTWPAVMRLLRAGDTLSIHLDSPAAHRLAGAARPLGEPRVSRVMRGGPAAKSGLLAGDRIDSINGRPISEWSDLQKTVSESGGETLVLGVVRGEERLTVNLVPDVQSQQKESGEVEKVGRIGIQSAVETIPRRYGVLDGLWTALIMVGDFILLFFDVLWRLVTGHLPTSLLAGPVGIAQVSGEYLKQGFHQFLMFLALINANLGFVNLLPFFLITDGGLIFLFLIEGVRKRKMSIKSLERWHQIGWAMVFTLLIMATYNDLMIRMELGEKISRAIDRLK